MNPEIRASYWIISVQPTRRLAKKDKKSWAKLQTELEQLKSSPAGTEACERGQIGSVPFRPIPRKNRNVNFYRLKKLL
jgi:hypothetical protein